MLDIIPLYGVFIKKIKKIIVAVGIKN